METPLSGLLSKTIALTKHTTQHIQDLLAPHSHSHSQLSGILINPEALFSLIHSIQLSEMRSSQPSKYFQLTTQIMGFIKLTIEEFSLNAKFIYEHCPPPTDNHHKHSFITYLIQDITEAQRLAHSTQHHKLLLNNYIRTSTAVYELICSECTLRTSQLQLITNSLTEFYYRQQLSTQLIGHCLRLLETGLQQRNITPYLYFLGSKKDGVKLLLSNNKWAFSKGMTVFLWVKALKETDCRLLWLKTEDGNELVVRVIGSKILVQSSTKDKTDDCSVSVCELPLNSLFLLGIELQPISEGFFKSNTYTLNLAINGTIYKNVSNKIAKFQSSQFITEFQLLTSFIGNLYGVVITVKPQLNACQQLLKFAKYGICRENIVWSLIDSKILKTQSIICIFNSQRCFQGLLLNYVCQKNHACFEGRVSSVAYHKYDSKIIEIYLPFLYLLTLVQQKEQLKLEMHEHQKDKGEKEGGLEEQWEEVFDLTMKHILQIIGKENYESESVLMLLLFLEVNEYRISQSTLNYLYDCSKQHSNFYIKIIVKYLDIHALIARGLQIDESVESYEDPVQKTIFLFYLECGWNRKWNTLQGFEGWWSPLFFRSQIDHPFHPKDFQHDAKREWRVEWSVKNMVSRDYCKCFLQPIFQLPKFGQLTKYRQQYISKQCFEEFKLKLTHRPTKPLLICHKNYNSSLEKIKNKLLGPNHTSLQTSNKHHSFPEIKEFGTECLFVDTLTVVQGIVRVTKEGYVVFSQLHKSSRFDRMCIRGYQNEQFLYVALAMREICKVYRKRYNASTSAVEIKTKDGREIMLYFYRRDPDPNKKKDLELFIASLQPCVKVKKDAYSNYSYSRKPIRWIDKLISNYEYLQWLNEIAGRSYSDISQYPVIPWVYVAASQQLESPPPPKLLYRDLTKNMGLQGDQERIDRFMEKYKNEDENELFSQYHFGSHYSSSAIIFNFLVRLRPYSLGAMSLQSGKFDVADRLFYSYLGSWNNATTSPTDLRELIPELYTLPELYLNLNNYDYGLTQDKIPIDNVILPNWANQNPYCFVAEIRSQLESDYVSKNISDWINLIYGYKQRGKDAVENINIFYPLTYQNCIDLEKVTDQAELESFQTQIAHFGQNPSQIIGNNPHPKRLEVKPHWEGKLIGDAHQLIVQKCFLSDAPASDSKIGLKSIFEGRKVVLGVKFVSEQFFFVLRKHEYCLFQILGKPNNFLSKEQEVKYELESIQISLNYKEIGSVVPMACIHDQLVIIGGFYNGLVQIVFLKESKFNRSFSLASATITALYYHPHHEILYVGDSEGYLRVYNLATTSKYVEFEEIRMAKNHDSKINSISLSIAANLITVCSQDGLICLYNSYSIEIVRTLRHPTGLGVNFALITTNPLYGVVFYSQQNSTVYSYSLNGQFLESLNEKSGLIYNMSTVKDSRFADSLVYLNAQKEMQLFSLPFLRPKRKIKVKKDELRVTCFQTCNNSKIALAGTEDGALHIVANPQSY